jgi:hypothetical protein
MRAPILALLLLALASSRQAFAAETVGTRTRLPGILISGRSAVIRSHRQQPVYALLLLTPLCLSPPAV